MILYLRRGLAVCVLSECLGWECRFFPLPVSKKIAKKQEFRRSMISRRCLSTRPSQYFPFAAKALFLEVNALHRGRKQTSQFSSFAIVWWICSGMECRQAWRRLMHSNFISDFQPLPFLISISGMSVLQVRFPTTTSFSLCNCIFQVFVRRRMSFRGTDQLKLLSVYLIRPRRNLIFARFPISPGIGSLPV